MESIWEFFSKPKSQVSSHPTTASATPPSDTGNTFEINPFKSLSLSLGVSKKTDRVEPEEEPNKAPPELPFFGNLKTKEERNAEHPKKLSFQERKKLLLDEIEKPTLDIKKIRSFATDGLPEGHIRAIYWRVLLNYLPLKRTEWASALKSTRGQYKEWQSDPDLVIDPHREQGEVNEPEDVTEFDHPLKQSEQSVWYKYFQDNEILHEIEKDVHRTFPHLHFFQIDNPDDTMSGRLIQNEHYRSLRRILFLYAKLNRGISYIQGMNELLAPIYYSFATDPDTEWKSYAEEDAFWCFTNLMSELRDNFDKSHDQAINGIQERMKVFNNILKMKDPALWLDLESKQMNPQFYSFRWITLLLSQEFELPDVLRIWDTLFSDEKRFDQLLYICTAMLIRLRKDILAADFAETLKLLQTYPPCDVLEIIQFSREIAHPDYYYSPPVQEEEQEGEGGTDGIEDSE